MWRRRAQQHHVDDTGRDNDEQREFPGDEVSHAVVDGAELRLCRKQRQNPQKGDTVRRVHGRQDGARPSLP